MTGNKEKMQRLKRKKQKKKMGRKKFRSNERKRER